MGLFSSSKSSSSSTNNTTNVDKRIATGEGGFVFQTDGSNSVINFEDINQDVVNEALNLAGSFISEASGIFDKVHESTTQALGQTQMFAQNLFEEKQTPSSDNIRNIIYAITAGVALVGYSYFRGK